MAYQNKPKGCEGCPAYNYGVGFVPPSTPENPKLVLIGQGPGQQEAYNSKPFFYLAPIGERLNKWLYHAGISRTKIAIGNLVQCWLPATHRNGVPLGNREPTTQEMVWCWNAHVGPWIHRLMGGNGDQRVVVVPVGVPASRFLLKIPPKKAADKFLGTLNWVELPELRENKLKETTL